MVHQISSNENFPIAYAIDDPTDGTLYYVQTKVYNGIDNTLLATINLTSQGSGLWTNLWKSVSDTSGLGRYIYLITQVYNDSGYSQLNTRYARQIETYLVQNRMNPNLGFGGGGESVIKIDDKILRKSIALLMNEAIRAELPAFRAHVESSTQSGVRQMVDAILGNKIDLSGMVTQKDAHEMKIALKALHDSFGEFPNKLVNHSEITKGHINKAIELIATHIVDSLTKEIKNSYSVIGKSLGDASSDMKLDRDQVISDISSRVYDILEQGMGSITFEPPKLQMRKGEKPSPTPNDLAKRVKEMFKKGISRKEIEERLA